MRFLAILLLAACGPVQQDVPDPSPSRLVIECMNDPLGEFESEEERARICRVD